ncbi:hypothetical protein, partial [Mesorhizobium sp. M4B.F.Ca.ET.200.01.1.1]|uniref:hypothetical protein n=1 Tax=Mesorhizobium sp. M4B.F.Ca.ET.200.01.1.1 TaxID=2563952 RepID=UPI001AEEA974
MNIPVDAVDQLLDLLDFQAIVAGDPGTEAEEPVAAIIWAALGKWSQAIVHDSGDNPENLPVVITVCGVQVLDKIGGVGVSKKLEELLSFCADRSDLQALNGFAGKNP